MWEGGLEGGAERLKTLGTMGNEQVRRTMRWMKEDLRGQQGVLICKGSKRYCKARLLMVLKVMSRILVQLKFGFLLKSIHKEKEVTVINKRSNYYVKENGGTFGCESHTEDIKAT